MEPTDHVTRGFSPEGRRRVGCRLLLEVHAVAEAAFQISAALSVGEIEHERLLVDGEPISRYRELFDAHLGRIHVTDLPVGQHAVEYEAGIAASPPHRRDVAPSVVDYERLVHLRPSRYCPSDRLGGFASSEFGHLSSVEEQTDAIATWIYGRISYQLGSSDRHESAEDTLVLGRGTCRDFAHLGIALCRGLGIPARFTAVYAPGLSPMDFHAIFESFRDGRWWAHDATRLAPRQSLVRIATGRDATDTAFFSVFPDTVDLRELWVTAVTDGALPTDDQHSPVELA